jgi:hypothetical protein
VALALAAEFRVVDVDGRDGGARRTRRGAGAVGRAARGAARGLREVLGARAGFVGDREDFNAPENSMLDVVLERRSGLPILLATVWTEAARRAGSPGGRRAARALRGRPLRHRPAAPGRSFARGRAVTAAVPERFVRPSPVTSTVLRMCNNLVRSYTERAD